MGRDDEARQVVHKLHGSTPEKIAAAEEEYNQMYVSIKAEASIKSRRLSDLWSTRAMTRRTLVACGVQVFCQFTGINGTFWLAFNPVPNVLTAESFS